MEDHKEIYLQPLFPGGDGENDWYEPEGRFWSPSNIWHESDYDGVEATRYVRADIFEQLEQSKSVLIEENKEQQRYILQLESENAQLKECINEIKSGLMRRARVDWSNPAWNEVNRLTNKG